MNNLFLCCLIILAFLFVYSVGSDVYETEKLFFNCSKQEKNGTQPALSLNLNVTSATTRVGTDSLLQIHGDFDCPFLKCEMDFGDDEVEAIHDVVNGSLFKHRYAATGEYNVSGICYSHHNQEKLETRAMVIDPLLVHEVVYEDSCFAIGETYIVKAQFKHAATKNWRIEIDGSTIPNSDDMVSEAGANATVRITPNLYGDYGDKKLRISVYDAYGNLNIVETKMCVRRMTEKFYMSVVPAAAPGQSVKFNLHKTDASANGVAYITFGDGSDQTLNTLLYPITSTYKTYSNVGTFTYTWKVTDTVVISQGSGIMKILKPISAPSMYFNPSPFGATWPTNHINFILGVRCYDKSPNAEYRIHFGDGVVSAWLAVPTFDCFRSGNLISHTYTYPDCFEVYIEIRNYLSRKTFKTSLSIELAISAVQLALNNVPPMQITEKEVSGMTEVYLRDSYPIRVTANVTGDRCLTFIWSIDSISWSQNTGRVNRVTINELIGRSGSYVLKVTVSNNVNSMIARKRIVLVKTIVGLELLNAEPTASGDVDFYLLVENPGINVTFFWNFGDGHFLNSTKLIFRPALDIPNIRNIEGANSLNLTIHFATILRYHYAAEGLYKAEVLAKDSFTTVQAKRDVFLSSDKLCERPTVEIVHKVGQPLTFAFVGSITVLANVKINCESSNNVEFEWQLYSSEKVMMDKHRRAESDKLISFPAGVVTDQRNLRIEKRTLSPGVYIIKLSVEMKGFGLSKSDEAYIEITKEPLHAEISGTTTRVLSWDKDIFLDARNSRDPNLAAPSSSNLRYKWYCRVKPGSLEFTIGRGGCFGYGEWIVEHHKSTWTISAKALVKNVVYIIRLRIESLSIAGAFAEVEQFIDVQSGAVISASVDCKSNCRRNIDPESRLSLVGICADCGRYLQYKWELLARDTFVKIPVRWMTDTLTSQHSVSLVLLPFWLTKTKEYLARFTVTTPSGESSYADYGFKLSTPPAGGFCNATPTVGEAIKTKFLISCYNWTGSTQSLQYSISLVLPQQQQSGEEKGKATSLISYGASSSTEATLQQGLAELDYTQKLIIRISDSYGASAETNITVQVRPFTVKKKDKEEEETLSVENELETFVYGKNSRLSTLVGTGSVQELGRFTKAIGKSLDSAKKDSTDAKIADEEKNNRKEKRKNMRTTMVNSLTDVRLTNLDNFAVISSALKDVSSSEDEVTEGAQNKMLNYFEGASKFLEGSYSTWGERDPKEIQDAFQGFLEGVGNIIESATTSKTGNTATNRSSDQFKAFTENSLKVIGNSTSLLFRSLVAEEAARRINGESLSIELKRSEVDRLNSRIVGTLGGGHLQTPSARSFLGDEDKANVTTVDTEMLTLLRNPHILDEENIGKSMTPTISSLKFLSDSQELEVKNLTKGDEFIIEIPNPLAKMVNGSATLKIGQMKFVRLRLPVKGAKFLLKIRCFGAPCDVFINYGAMPSPANFSEKFSLEDSSLTSKQSGFRIYHSMNHTKFNIGILYNDSSVSTSISKTVSYDLEAFITGCYYWKEISNKWSSEGCKISNRTTLNKTICICDHLSWFGGGFFVQPNNLDIAVEVMKIADIADYPALLATFCTLIGCYIIAVIFARRGDKSDALKTSLIIPEDCCQSHKCRYDVTITSGSRPGSGTSASVYMILVGSRGESHPFCLNHLTEAVFQRGSVDSFLITAEHDLGDIEYIRLWHDNTGRSPGWFVSRASATNILTGKQTQFLCNTWLAIGVGEGKIDNIFVAAKERELKSFESIFLSKTSQGFSDDHIWFSVTMRPPRSPFTRVQRISCCLCALLCTMLTNAMFYKREVGKVGENIKIGSMSFNWKQIMIGVQSALIVIPVNLLIVTLFRRAAPAPRKLVEEQSESTIANTDGTVPAVGVTEGSSIDGVQFDITKATVDISKRLIAPAIGNASGSLPNVVLAGRSNGEKQMDQAGDVAGTYRQVSSTAVHNSDACASRAKLTVGRSNTQMYLDHAEDTTGIPIEYQSGNGVPVQEYDGADGNPVEYPFMNIISDDTLDLISSLNPSDKEKDIGKHSDEEVVRNNRLDNQTIDFVQPDIACSNSGYPNESQHVDSSRHIVLDIDDDDMGDDYMSRSLPSRSTLELTHYLNKEIDKEKSDDGIEILKSNPPSLEFEKTDEVEESNSYQEEDGDAETVKKMEDAQTFWPHWCQIFAWIFCFLATTTAGFFTLLYGLSFGRETQEEWLVSFFTSVFQDVFISQPVKVLVIGCVFGLIIKKIAEQNVLPEVFLAKDKEWVKTHLPLQERRCTSSNIHIPLTQSYVEKAHAERLNQMKMTDLSLEIVAYLFYIFLVLLIAYGHRAPDAFAMTNNLNTMIITDKFERITNAESFWDWAYEYFLPNIYGEVWYNDEPTRHKGFLSDQVTYLLGSPRFRQLRVVEDTCPASSSPFDINRTRCGAEYSSSNEEHRSYQAGWKVPTEKNSTSEEPDLSGDSPWKYHSQIELRGHPFLADLRTYSGSGYVKSIGRTLSQAEVSIGYLKDNLWIDSLTRALFIEFATYNNNNNFYCIVTLLLEFTSEGGAFPFVRIVTTRLDRYNSDFSFFLAACEISFLLLTIYYMWLEIKKFRRKGMLYFKEWGTFVELLLLSMTWATFALLIVRFGVVRWTKEKYKNAPTEFTSFQYAASTDQAYGYTLACVVFVAFLKVLKILRFNKNMLMLYETLKYASRDLRCYGLLFSIPCIGYVQWAYLAFGSQLVDYVTYIRSFLSVMNLLMGSGNFEDLRDANRIVGPIFFVLFVVTMGFVLMNMFLSIIMQAFAEVRRLMADRKNKYEIIEFVYEKIMRLLPCCKVGLNAEHLGAVHSNRKVDDYYKKRRQERQGALPEYEVAASIEAVLQRLERLDDVVNECLLCEYEDLDELSQLAMELKGKTHEESSE